MNNSQHRRSDSYKGGSKPRKSRRHLRSNHPRNLAAIGAAFFLCSSDPPSTNAQVPGLVYTESGYDNVDGHDPICWWAFADHNNTGADPDDHESDSFDGYNWRNDLVPTFTAGPTTMMPACPRGLNVHVDAPLEFVTGESLYAGVSYAYHVVGEIQLDSLRAEFGLSSDSFFYSVDGTHRVAIKLLFCPVNGNFCSPFIFMIREGSDDSQEEEEEEDSPVSEDGDERRMGAKPHETETTFVHFHNMTQNVFKFDFKATVTMDSPGAYLPLGSLLLFLNNGTIHRRNSSLDEGAALKFDSANLLYQRLIDYKKPPQINEVNTAVEILSYSIIGIVAVLEAALLLSIAKHRNHSVVKLSQGTFLILFLGMAVVASACSFLVNPKSDIYCNLYGPLIMIPLQLMLAVIIGRLRRITSIMAPLMKWQSGTTSSSKIRLIQTTVLKWARGFSKKDSTEPGTYSTSQSDRNDNSSPAYHQQSRLRNLMPKPKTPQKRSLRTEFTSTRLWMWVVTITLPQVIVQVVGLVVFPSSLNLELDKSESIGRYECQCETFKEYDLIQFAVLFVTMLFLLFESQRSRNLPSLFNEAKSLGAALITLIFILILGVAVLVLMDDPTTSPDARYILSIAIILCLTLNLSLRLVYPKLKLIWRGEKVMVSKLLDDHKKKQRAKALRRLHQSSVVRLSSRRPVISQRIDEPIKEDEEPHADKEGTAAAINTALPVAERAKHFLKSNVESEITMDNGDNAKQEKECGAQSNPCHSNILQDSIFKNENQRLQCDTRNMKEVSFLQPSENSVLSECTPMMINSIASPPSRIVASIMEHTELMSRVNSRIFSGLQVPRDDWELVQASLERMNLLFAQIKFSWDEDGETNGDATLNGMDI